MSWMHLIGTIALGSVLAACQTTKGVPPGMYHNLQDYLAADDFKAMAAARRHGDNGWSFSWNWSLPSARSAVETVMDACRKNSLGSEAFLAECRLQYVGSVNVLGMDQSALETVIRDYETSASGPPATEAKVEESTDPVETRRVTVEWESYGEGITGIVQFRALNKGDIFVQLPVEGGECRGFFLMASQAKGNWRLTCANGRSGSGDFEVRGKQRVGSGEDDLGNTIEFVVGAAG